MKFRLGATCDVRTGLLLLVDQQVEDVLARIARPTAPDRAQDVHATRLALKRLRSIWHLIRSSVLGPTACEENQKLREAAAWLAQPRDAVIAREALAALLAEDILPNQRAAIVAIQDRLEAQGSAPAAPCDADAALRHVEPVLRQTLAALRQTHLAGDGWPALAPGLTHTVTRLHRACARARARGRDEDFHEWRKLIKRAQFQFELIRPAWPKRLRPAIKALRELGDKLGDDHDLFILRQRLTAAPAPGTLGTPGSPESPGSSNPSCPLAPAATIALVEQVIAAKSRRLRARCLQMWSETLDHKPKGFLRRLERHYRVWHPSPTRQPVAA
jgi:CHAD domain-containing protein